MKEKLKERPFIIFAVVAVIFGFLPIIIKNNFFITTMVYTFIFASFGVAWNLIGGYGAQISWCHSAFVAIGSYSSYILYNIFNITPFISMFLGAGISLAVATIIGYGSFRLRGPFFTLSTIAFAEIVRVLLLYFKNVTNGASGMWITYKKPSFLSLTFQNDQPFYYISLLLMILIVLFTIWFERSKTGYYLKAIKGDEDAASSLGIETFKVKLRAFQISAVFVSIIGAFYSFFLTYIDPTAIAGMDLSIRIGTTAIVGGLGTVMGPVLGAFVLQPLNQIINQVFGNIGGASQMVYGLFLIIIVIFRPDGLISFFKSGKSNSKGGIKK